MYISVSGISLYGFGYGYGSPHFLPYSETFNWIFITSYFPFHLTWNSDCVSGKFFNKLYEIIIFHFSVCKWKWTKNPLFCICLFKICDSIMNEVLIGSSNWLRDNDNTLRNFISFHFLPYHPYQWESSSGWTHGKGERFKRMRIFWNLI